MGTGASKSLKDLKDIDCNSVIIIWVDANINSSRDNIEIQSKLRKDHRILVTFDQLENCFEYLQNPMKEKQFLLITSGSIGEVLVPKVHSYMHISSIYLFCGNKIYHDAWAKKYKKIRDVLTEENDLVQRVLCTYNSINKVNEPLEFSFFNQCGRSTTELNGCFIQNQLLIDCLLRMSPNENEKKEFINFCKIKFKGKHCALNELDDFDKHYSPENAIWWYTKEMFLYRMLNGALRTQDIDTLVVLRFFIRDLQELLKKHQIKESLHAYRGQQMTVTEFDLMKNSIGKLLSFNSFLSATSDEQCARQFLETKENYAKILFDIEANPPFIKNRAVADITDLSFIKEEKEVLFMIGSIFHLSNIIEQTDGSFIVKLISCSTGDPMVESIIETMKTEYCDNDDSDTDLLSLGVVLSNMGKYDKARQYFQQLLKILPENHEDIGRCYFNLGSVASVQDAYDESFRWYKKLLKWENKRKSNSEFRVQVYLCFGELYDRKGDFQDSISAYKQALRISDDIAGDNQPMIALCLNNIGNIYQKQDEFGEALDYHKKALDIHENYFPKDYSRLSLTHNNIGIDYKGLGHYDSALFHLEKSLDIKKRILPQGHPDFAKTLASIGHVYLDQNNASKALEYFNKAALIFRTAFSHDHSCVVQIENDIEIAYRLI